MLAASVRADEDELPQTPVTYLADSPAAQELLDEANRLAAEDQSLDAARTLQQIIDTYPDRLLAGPGQRYANATQAVLDDLRRKPKVLQAYHQLYDSLAQRQLDEAVTADRLDVAALEQIVRRYLATPAGLTAVLHLAALHLERGEIDFAASRLDQAARHPELEQHPDADQRRLRMLAYVQAARGDDLATQTLDKLTAAGVEVQDDLDAVQAILAEAQAAKRNARPADVDETGQPLPDPALGHPSWQRAAPQDAALTDDDDDGDGLAQLMMRQSGQNPAAMRIVRLTLAGPLLVIHDGTSLRVWDAASGRSRWTQPLEQTQTVRQLNARMRMISSTLSPPRQPAVYGDRVFAILGGSPISTFFSGAASGRLDCYSLQTGQLLWKLKPEQIDPTLEGAGFQGRAVVSDGRLYVLVSRQQPGSFNEVYLAALAPETGKVFWSRHIASSSASAYQQAGDASGETVIPAGQRVIVTDGMGVIAAISSLDGSIEWARMFASDLQPVRGRRAMFAPVQQSDVSPPRHVAAVLCDAGLIVPVTWRQDDHGAMRVDPASGQVLNETLPAAGDNIMATASLAGDLLTLDAEQGLTRLDGRTLKVVWRQPVADVDVGAQLDAAGSLIVVATEKQLQLRDAATGEIKQTQPLASPARLHLTPGQLVLTQGETISSFMAWDLALQRLARQMQQQPHNPDPGLALARMGWNERKDDQMFAGLDHALDAANDAVLRDDDAVQQQVFDEALELGQDASVGGRYGPADAIFDRLNKATRSTHQQVLYQVALGEHLARSGRGEQAATAYQAILLNDSMLGEDIAVDGVSQPAELVAQLRLKALIHEQGRTLYERFETQATSELTAAAGDPRALAQVAAHYPLAGAAVEALSQAGDLYAEQGDMAAAAQLYRQAMRHDPTQAMKRSLASRMIHSLELAGQIRQARYWLRRLARHEPSLTLTRDGRTVEADQWLAMLQDQDEVDPNPRVQLPLQPALALDGRLLTPLIATVTPQAAPGVLTRAGSMLRYYDAATGRLLWQLDRPNVQLLWQDASQVLLWHAEASLVEGLQPQTGRALWPSVNVDEALAVVEPRAQDTDQQRGVRRRVIRGANGAQVVVNMQINGGAVLIQQPGMPGDAGDIALTPQQHLFAVGALSLVISDNRGRVMALDRITGEVQWRQATTIALPTALAVSDDSVAIAGVMDSQTAAQMRQNLANPQDLLGNVDGEGGVMTLDLELGESLRPMHRPPSTPFWVGFNDDDLLVVATHDQIIGYQLTDNTQAWATDLSSEQLAGQAWASGNTLLATEQLNNTLALFDLTTGDCLKRLSLQSISAAAPNLRVDVQCRAGLWYACLPQRLVCFDGQGRMKWQDGLLHDVDTPVFDMLAGDRHVFAVQQTGFRKPDRVGQTSPLQVVALDRESGLATQAFELPSLNTPASQSAAAFVINGLAIGNGDQTLLVRGSE